MSIKIKFRVWDKRENKGSLTQSMVYEAQSSSLWKDFIDYPEVYALMQFTGLEDRSGKKIFEGDILSFDDLDENYQVYYDGSAFCLCNKAPLFVSPLDEWEIDRCQIIGNIFQNPELLK